MKIKYFPETDTALIEFSSGEIVETRDVSEDVQLDLDANGHVVSMTIEHARTSASMKEFSYQELGGVAA